MKLRFYSRRSFLKMCMASSAALCVSKCASDENSDAQARNQGNSTGFFGQESVDNAQVNTGDADVVLEELSQKPAVIWMQAQDCAGCTESVFSSFMVDYAALLLDDINLCYHETLMAACGELSNHLLEQTISEGDYLLVVEGAFPGADTRYLQVRAEPLQNHFISAATNAAAIIALGACASFGAIPKVGPTEGRGVGSLLEAFRIDKLLINIPGCPVHPIWFFDTVQGILTGEIPAVDEHLRPLIHFSRKVHDLCPRIRFNRRKRFLVDWNNPVQRNFCLYLKGCKGMSTFANCPTLLWNGRANYCMGSCSPCAGCTQPEFCSEWLPLYTNPQV